MRNINCSDTGSNRAQTKLARRVTENQYGPEVSRFFFFFAVLGFELRASHLVGSHS
jgi:hypothetical protein